MHQKQRWFLVCALITASITAASMEPGPESRQAEPPAAEPRPKLTVTEIRRPSGDSELCLVDREGQLQAAYRIVLSRHDSPATEAIEPMYAQRV